VENLKIIPRDAAGLMEKEKADPSIHDTDSMSHDNLREWTQVTGKKSIKQCNLVIEYSTRLWKGNLLQNVLSNNVTIISICQAVYLHISKQERI
jgi:hypothetical protein